MVHATPSQTMAQGVITYFAVQDFIQKKALIKDL